MTRKKQKPPEIALASDLDVDMAAALYSKLGRVHIPGALSAATIKKLQSAVAKGIPWKLHFNNGNVVYDLDPQQYAALSDAERGALNKAIHGQAAHKFQFLFENFPVSDMHDAGEYQDHYVMRIYEFLNSETFLNLARKITGVNEISLVDAQLTRYQPGHFLTCHDDEVAGKNRVAAYVLGLSPDWQADWGGLLNFIDKDGHVSEGYVPRINALNVFRVPQKHAVGCVAPFAPGARVSLSGWFRC